MKVFRSFADFSPSRSGTAVAIGTFDGLHLGHRKILARLTEIASRRKLYSLVLTFYAHSAPGMNKHRIPLVQTLSQRLEVLSQTGVQGVLVVPLVKKVSSLSGRAFAEDFLQKILKTKAVVVGKRFRFGKGRKCGVVKLREFGNQLGFETTVIPPVKSGRRIVSSSLIRRLIKEGRVDSAEKLLGWPFEIEGRVVRGRARGTRLGFPTANLNSTNDLLPRGVFLTEIVIGRTVLGSLTNIGTSPTFGKNPLRIETFVLGFKDRLYGRTLKIRFLKKLRSERKFRSSKALVGQLNRDLERAKRFFSKRKETCPRPFLDFLS